MKIILLCVVLSFASLQVKAQVPQSEREASSPTMEAIKEDSNQIYTVVQQQPIFPGGQEGLAKFLRKNFKYPRNAQRMGIESKIFVRFVVRKTGEVTDVNIVRGIANCNECNEEAMHLVKMMPKWEPGLQNGKPVDVYYSLPLIICMKE